MGSRMTFEHGVRSAPATDALWPHGRENLRHLISEGELAARASTQAQNYILKGWHNEALGKRM